MNPLRLTTLCVCLTMVASTLYAQPRMVVQSEVDWGKVVPTGPATEQQSVRTKISIKNVGNEMLHIHEIRPSCGCVTQLLERDSVEPGGEVALNVSMNLPVGNGPLRKTLTILTNESTDSIHVVVLSAELVRPIQLSSGFIPFNTSIAGTLSHGEITITSFAPESVRVTVAALGDSIEVLSQNPLMLTKGNPQTIRLSYKPTQTGSYRVDVDLRTTLPGYETIPISGFGVATPSPER